MTHTQVPVPFILRTHFDTHRQSQQEGKCFKRHIYAVTLIYFYSALGSQIPQFTVHLASLRHKSHSSLSWEAET